MSKRLIVVLVLIFLVALGGVAWFGYQIYSMGFHKGFDHVFGDQHLKTAVGLIELHRVRNGSYPSALSELKHIGSWDQIALHSVRYCPSADRRAYYVEVTRGWIGKPTLTMPPDFWQGTGYRPEVVKECR